MRKYRMPKVLYFVLVLILFVLTFDYTYAYFSAETTATGQLGVKRIAVQWYYTDGEELGGFPQDSTGTINMSATPLTLGEYNYIVYNGVQVSLILSPTVETPAYLRLKVEASYKNDSGIQVDCSQYVKLAISGSQLELFDMWTLEDGYYYYKTDEGLTEITSSSTISVCNHLYLDTNIGAIYGKEFTITLTAEMIQSSYGAADYLWFDQ